MGSTSAKMVIPSKLAEVPQVQQAVLDRMEAHGYGREATFAVRLALEEALSNAIRHGNGCDPGKTVTVEYEVDDQAVRVQIRDEGGGFCPTDVDDPTLEENLCRPCGRGVMLMKAYMTEVHFNEAGNCVTLVRARNDDSRSGLPEGDAPA